MSQTWWKREVLHGRKVQGYHQRTLTVLSANDDSTIRWYLKGGRLSSVPEELKSHFLAMAYSMARTLPSCPFSAVFFEYKWRSQTYTTKASFKSEAVAADVKYQDVPRLSPTKNIRLGCSQTKNGTIRLVYRVK